MLSIQINGNSHSFQEQTSLLVVLKELKINQNGIAVAVNQSIVSKENWATATLKNNDEILIIKATQGG